MIKNILLFSLGLLFFASCSSNKNEAMENASDSLFVNLSSNQANVYYLPSPFQVSTFLKLLEIKYDNSLIYDKKINYKSKAYKAINLGRQIVDLYYVTSFEQYYSAPKILDNIENLMYELGLKNNVDNKLVEELANNIKNNDSLKSIMRKYESGFDEYFSIAEEKKITFLIVAGIYVEGLYISSELYNSQLVKRKATSFYRNGYYLMLLQQKIYLHNLIELLSGYNEENVSEILSQLKELETNFNKLNIQYKETGFKINKITLEKSRIEEIRKNVNSVRNNFINETHQ